MKLLSFSYQGRDSWGAVRGDAVVDLRDRCASLMEFIAGPDFAQRDEIVNSHRTTIPLAEIQFLPVIPRPEKIALLVRNYLDHHQEVLAAGMNRDLSAFPPLFLRYASSQIGHQRPIIRPIVSEQLDWEGELAVVIGKAGRHIPEQTALSHVAGYSVYNDASIREYQFHAKQIAAGKNFDGTGAFGPWLVTTDELADATNLNIQTRLNGQVVQLSNTQQMIFKIPTFINYVSQIFELQPGDVLVTGTPAGVGWSRKPPLFMKKGDVVEVEIEKIGVLRNPIVDEADLPR